MAIPLTPKRGGGRSAHPTSLHIADIILSTSSAAISMVIRGATSSPVSHTILYIGGGQVVEAIGDGIVLRTLHQALSDATLAVAYRHPSLSATQALMVRDFVGNQLGKGYGFVGAAVSINKVLCLMSGSKDRFFCSELVLDAYKHAGAPITYSPPHCNSPGDIAMVAVYKLSYIGHLRT
jgi:uncharacterized protein YycO